MEGQSRIEGLHASDASARHAVSEALRRINRAWLEGRPNDIAPLLHPAMSMVYPGFAGRSVGREMIVAGFVDFCANARVISYREDDAQVDVAGDTAVASNTFDMVYERTGETYHATGRDLWVFTRHNGEWVGAWRTMLDLAEHPA
jgi:ketosteroid isomerase-like protein